jgi:hypothetical protein
LVRRAVSIVAALFLLAIIYTNVFPGNYGVGITATNKPVILYYNYGEQPFAISAFPNVVAFASSHGFNTLMLVVYIDHDPIFNNSILRSFYEYAQTKNVTFVPSYYIESLNDTINVSGFSWINLDMERLSQSDQAIYYGNMSKIVPLASVTMPYGENPLFYTKMLIVETYASPPIFWLEQITYSHGGTICSVHINYVHSEQEYRSEFDYCLKYSDGVMVFDYPILVRSGY